MRNNTLIALSLALCASQSFASTVLREYWEYDAYIEQHPEQKQLISDMSLRIYQPPVPIQTQQDKPIDIDIVYPGSQLSDYWWRNIKALELRLNELDIDYRLRKYSSRPSLDYRQESESLQTVLQDPPDYLLFTLDTSRQKKFAETILNSSDTKLILINITTPIKQWHENQPLMYVGFDHVHGTQLLAKEYLKRFPEKADFGVMYFSPGYISEARGDSFVQYVKHHGDYSLKRAYFTDANRESAYKATLSMLEKEPNIEFIYACSTDVAFGVADALAKLDRQDIVVNGWGGGSEIQAVQNGDLDFTVVRMTDDTGIAMAEAIKLDLQGSPVPQVFSGDFKILSKSDSSEEVDVLRNKAFRYSNF
ncbi:ABC transporter substrate-binding protein [Vibrio sp. UCD-FRSSP16_10]|uniref:substrate-binding domain-containing protein n=1 Tax=unclassified Vibrio TaxID=2614977 RepID=UPI0007FDD4B9|nr:MULTISPECIES: substrate-binding domain-containing protein [unclassified Vibrio]OBT13694.1 ABC transporter substrate-binding protein [Vibrio sp. UCD-FRSSP16_30]OBT20019.1 ABC transporter substrate-binding protein [Vibrio sp. UCD-FRSSP16_10]